MRILILGGDGYLGWPSALYLSARGHEVGLVDNFAKRGWEAELGVAPLFPILPLQSRVAAWREVSGRDLALYIGDLNDYHLVEEALGDFQPAAIVHFGEQPSAPYSMRGQREAVSTQVNNVVGTLNLLFAMREITPEAHLVKLGTLGEYGTPNIDIEEGFIEVEHSGRSDQLPFPKQPGSFYHLSKVHDSHNMMLAAKIWSLAITDLNQGVVYGLETEETSRDPRLVTSFHYDETFGTALNRFCVQAVIGWPLTVYGKGHQIRGFLDIRDTIRCVELALLNPAGPGEFRVFNQFAELFSVAQLASLVQGAAAKLGYAVRVQHVANPRVEMEEHYYNPKHTKLLDLGLEPHYLSDTLIDSMLEKIASHRDRIDTSLIPPRTGWRSGAADSPASQEKVTEIQGRQRSAQ